MKMFPEHENIMNEVNNRGKWEIYLNEKCELENRGSSNPEFDEVTKL
jgi:hypothetical protein